GVRGWASFVGAFLWRLQEGKKQRSGAEKIGSKLQRKPELGGSGFRSVGLPWQPRLHYALAGGQAGNQRNFAFCLGARHLRQFFFSRRFRELSSTDGSRPPNLREEIAMVVAVENQLRLGLRRVGLRCKCEHHDRRARVQAVNQEHPGTTVKFLDAIL